MGVYRNTRFLNFGTLASPNELCFRRKNMNFLDISSSWECVRQGFNTMDYIPTQKRPIHCELYYNKMKIQDYDLVPAMDNIKSSENFINIIFSQEFVAMGIRTALTKFVF